MQQSWYRKRILFVIVALLSAGLLAACGDDTDDDPAERADPTPTMEVSTPASVDSSTNDAAEVTPTPDAWNPEPESTPTAVPDPDGGGPFPVTVTRSDGVELTIDQRPERIVSLSAGATEIFFAIGAGDQMAAADMFSNYPPEAEDLPKVDAFQPDPEAIVAGDPDLVVVIYDADGIVEILDNLGVPVLYLEAPQDLEELMDEIRLLGKVTGHADGAEDLAASMEERIEVIVEQLEDVEQGLRIYHELDDSYFTVGPGSFIGDLYNTLKARNIAGEALGEYPQLSEEAILDANPEVIVAPSHGGEEGSVAEAIQNREGWDVIEAVQNGRVYEIDGDIVSRPGPRVVDALEQLAEMLYPERFVSLYEPVVAGVDFQIAA